MVGDVVWCSEKCRFYCRWNYMFDLCKAFSDEKLPAPCDYIAVILGGPCGYHLSVKELYGVKSELEEVIGG